MIVVIIWCFIKDTRRTFITQREWESSIEEYIMYTSLVIESLIFIQVLFAFKWKVSHINICLVMLNFRLTLGIYSLNDISENGKIQRIKFVDTLVSSCCLFMN